VLKKPGFSGIKAEDAQRSIMKAGAITRTIEVWRTLG
jgi:hypothetical protein